MPVILQTATADPSSQMPAVASLNPSSFKQETNLSIITDDGSYYTFNVKFAKEPLLLSIEMTDMTARRAAHREPGRCAPAQRPCQVLCPIFQIRQRLRSSRRISLQLRLRCRQQVQRPQKTEIRQLQHLQVLHLPPIATTKANGTKDSTPAAAWNSPPFLSRKNNHPYDFNEAIRVIVCLYTSGCSLTHRFRLSFAFIKLCIFWV